MSYKAPKDIAKAGVLTGSTKARLSWDKALVAGFLAGAYIAIAGLLAIVVSAGMPTEWGGLPTFITGTVFSLGLILVVIAGSELLTGNMALVPLAAMKGRASLKKLAENWAFVLLGNLLGALFVAWLVGIQTGVLTVPDTLERVDEPAAHLDPTAAERLQRGLAAAAGDRGVLLISHTPAGLDAFDEILVFEGGRVVERGTDAELRAAGGRYAALPATPPRGRWRGRTSWQSAFDPTARGESAPRGATPSRAAGRR